jgi:hypothetical protein
MNYYCYYACLAGDRSTAASLFQKIDERWEKNIRWTTKHYLECEQWATSSGPKPNSTTTNEVGSDVSTNTVGSGVSTNK